jgi:molybdopterin converting factor small subunit
MPVSVSVPTPLRRFTGGEKRVEIEGANVQAAIDALVESYPDLRAQLIDDSGELRKFVNLYLGDQNVRQLADSLADVPLPDGAELTIIPAIAGGTGAQAS